MEGTTRAQTWPLEDLSKNHEEVIGVVEDVFQSMLVARTWILCGSDEDALEATGWLHKHDHTTVCITSDDVEDERMRYVTKLHDFKGTARMLVMSYAAWKQIQEDVEVHVLPEQNLIMLWRIDDGAVPHIMRQLQDAALRGFVSRHPNATVVTL